MRDVRGRRISIIFQEPATSLNPVLPVGAQIIEVIERHTPLKGAAARAKALDWLKRVKLPEPERRIDSYPFQLSGGQKQRVMIAIALAAGWRPSNHTGVLLLAAPAALSAQTIDDALMMPQRQLCTGFIYTHDSWDRYWEGSLERSNAWSAVISLLTSGLTPTS